MTPQKIEISHKTIIFTIIFLASLFLLWSLRSLIALFFVCFILMEALHPTVTKLQKLKIPRPIAILILYIVILAFVSFSVAGVVPLLVEQTNGLVNTLPDAIANFSFFGASAIDLSSQFKILENIPGEIAKTVVSLFSNVFSAFVILVITFYLLLERRNFDDYSFNFFGIKGKVKALKIFGLLEKRLGSWLNAEILLMTIIGLLSYVAFLLLGLPYAVPLAILAGLLELIPNIGPTVSAVLAGLVGLTISPLTGVLAVLAGVLIQQLENNLIVPKIMKETVGINPLITILLLASGAKLGGIIGAILAVPIYLTVHSILQVLVFSKDDTTKAKSK